MITQNNILTIAGDITLTGPDSYESGPFFWNGGDGFISPRGSLYGDAILQVIFSIENDLIGTMGYGSPSKLIKQFSALDLLDGFKFWLPRGLFQIVVICDAEGDNCSNIGVNIIGLNASR